MRRRRRKRRRGEERINKKQQQQEEKETETRTNWKVYPPIVPYRFCDKEIFSFLGNLH